jgi:hypothetical protein
VPTVLTDKLSSSPDFETGTPLASRTKAPLIYRARRISELFNFSSDTKLESTVRYLGIEVDDAFESTVRYLGIEVDDAFEIAEQTEVESSLRMLPLFAAH